MPLLLTIAVASSSACANPSRESRADAIGTGQSAAMRLPAENIPAEKIARNEVRRIRREYTQVLDHERDLLRVEQARKLREGDTARRARKREWDAAEKAARRAFFAAHPHGPDRRQYVKEFNARRESFYEGLRNEDRRDRAELDTRWKAFRESQRARLVTVEEYLKRSERPPAAALEPEK